MKIKKLMFQTFLISTSKSYTRMKEGGDYDTINSPNFYGTLARCH